MAALLERVLGPEEPVDGSTLRILDAALDAFADIGIRRATMDDVARRARLGRATVYRRFPHKQALVGAVLLREARAFLAEIDRKVARAGTPEDRLVEGFVAFVAGVRSNALLRRMLTLEPDTVLPALTVDGDGVIALGRGYAAELIRDDQRAGLLPRFDPEPVAELMVRIGHSLVLAPGTVIPIDEQDAARTFARRHLAPMLAPYLD